MPIATDRSYNGVDIEKMHATTSLIKSRPELAKVQFRASNRWIDGTHNRSTIKNFRAGGVDDMSRSAKFQISAGQPSILLGSDTGPNPAEYLLHALAASLTTAIVYVASARGVDLASIESTLTADMDLRGVLGGDDDVPFAGFQHIGAAFRVTGDASDETLRDLVDRARHRSAVYALVASSVPVSVDVSTD